MSRWPTRPAPSTAVVYGLALHTDCGGAVTKPATWAAYFQCDLCHRHWSEDTLSRFSEEDFAVRFHVEVKDYDDSSKTLVWFTDPISRTRYTSLVSSAEADLKKYERVVGLL